VRVRRKLPAIRRNDPKASITGSEITKIHQEPHPPFVEKEKPKPVAPIGATTVVTRRNLNGKYRESRKWRDWIAKRTESPTGSAVATEEGLQAERFCGAERGLSAALGMKPKRVVFPIAGKGGVGKTTVMATLAEWYASTAYTPNFSIWTRTTKRRGASSALRQGAQLPALESWTYDRLLGISWSRAPM